MKVQEFAWQVAARTMELLEQEQHYKISDTARKTVLDKILAELNTIIRKSS